MSYQSCYWVGIQEQKRSNSLPSSLLHCLILGRFWFGVTEEMFWTYCGWIGGRFDCIPLGPLFLFNYAAELHTPWPVAPALAPVALQELELRAPCVPPCTLFCAFGFPLCGDAAPVLLVMEELQVEVWPRPVQPLWEFGQTEVFLVCPSSPMTPVPWATGGTGRVTTLLCPNQSGQQPCYLVPQLFWARGYLCSGSWPRLDFGFLCFAFGPPCSDH